MQTEIYALFDPRRPDDVRYVGKTHAGAARRRNRHVSETPEGRKRLSEAAKIRWQRERDK